MKARGKKFIAFFLIFFLLILPGNLYAKKRGAYLIITKKDGHQIEGELITVKPNSLLLLNTEGRDVSVDIADIKVIRVVKKSNALAWAALGFGAGALLGPYLYQVVTPEIFQEVTVGGILLVGFVGGAIGALFGALISASPGKDKIIQIEGMSDFEILKTLYKLRKKARISDYK